MWLKRAIDVAVSAALLVVLAPVYALIAIAVVLDSGLPVFYSQIRMGRGFQPFRIWKFRSMRRAVAGSVITVAGDARITRVGKLLRATKLDELPQFWNVLAGDMSLVGPRPELPDYVAMFRGRYQNILAVRPGITDLASIQFRNEERVLAHASDPLAAYVGQVLPAKLDLADEYLSRRSFRLDVTILAQSLLRVLRAF